MDYKDSDRKFGCLFTTIVVLAVGIYWFVSEHQAKVERDERAREAILGPRE